MMLILISSVVVVVLVWILILWHHGRSPMVRQDPSVPAGPGFRSGRRPVSSRETSRRIRQILSGLIHPDAWYWSDRQTRIRLMRTTADPIEHERKD